MLNTSSRFIAVAALVFAVSAFEAAPLNKCIVNGTVTYQQVPCASNQVRKDPTIEEMNAAKKQRRAEAGSTAATTPPRGSGACANGPVQRLQLRWAAILLSDAVMRRGQVLPRQMPRRQDGR
jgi:hypothetical protein